MEGANRGRFRREEGAKEEKKVKKITCPNCGYEWNENVEDIHEAGKTPVTRGVGKRARGSPESKKYVDLVCPNCKREFEYPVEL